MRLTEEKIGTIKRVQGRAVGFRIDNVRLPNRKAATREFLEHPGAVAVVAMAAPRRIVLVRQFRYAVGQTTYEIPAGKIDPGESLLTTARRELREETGMRAGRMRKLLSFWPTPAFGNEIIHVYLATNLKAGIAQPDDDEFVEAVEWPIEKVESAIRSGRIKDSKTIIGVLAIRSLFRHTR